MSVLDQLLERFRRAGPPSGVAPRAVAVPSRGDVLTSEVAFLFDELDAIDARASAMLSAARADAEAIERTAREAGARLLEAAHAEAESRGEQLVTERRAAVEPAAAALLDEAGREAELVLARARERTPGLVEEVVRRVAEGPV